MNKKEFIEKFGKERYEQKLKYYREWYNKNLKSKRVKPTLQEQKEIDIKNNEELTLQFVENYKGRWVFYEDCVVLDNGEIYRRGGLHNCCTNKEKKIFKRFKRVKESEGLNGYLSCMVGCKQDYIHRHVWRAFYGEIPKGLQIDHIDTNPHNNAIDNLRLVTTKENFQNPLTNKHQTYANKIKGLEKVIKRLEEENNQLRQMLAS